MCRRVHTGVCRRVHTGVCIQNKINKIDLQSSISNNRFLLIIDFCERSLWTIFERSLRRKSIFFVSIMGKSIMITSTSTSTSTSAERELYHVVPPTCLKWPQTSRKLHRGSGASCWCDTSLNKTNCSINKCCVPFPQQVLQVCHSDTIAMDFSSNIRQSICGEQQPAVVFSALQINARMHVWLTSNTLDGEKFGSTASRITYDNRMIVISMCRCVDV